MSDLIKSDNKKDIFVSNQPNIETNKNTKTLCYEAEPQILSLDIIYLIERGIEDLDCNVEFDLDDGNYPSDLAPSSYEKIEETLKKAGIDIEALNKQINKAMFGEDECLKYYPYKEVEEE
ncbi:hypothetical protein [Brachyspira alvinipulli]|uniref:hypothetical protein n=1 Tax=Brachyspira alvinipulli TaxID=84379 RepID=UPI00047F18B9|nr:hypothetical protein [Brachyspira alvinipulli]